MDYLEAIAKRRSIYDLKPESSLSDDELVEVLCQVMNDIPSAVNGQFARMVLLLKEDHKSFWEEIVMEALRKKVDDKEKFKKTEEKIKGFAHSYGTILFYQDLDAVRAQKEKFPSYAHNFDQWASEGDGILLGAIWTALASLNMGASIQHYNPLIDEEVQEKYDLPDSWKLIGQMPFGKITSYPDEKEKIPAEEKIRIFGK